MKRSPWVGSTVSWAHRHEQDGKSRLSGKHVDAVVDGSILEDLVDFVHHLVVSSLGFRVRVVLVRAEVMSPDGKNVGHGRCRKLCVV